MGRVREKFRRKLHPSPDQTLQDNATHATPEPTLTGNRQSETLSSASGNSQAEPQADPQIEPETGPENKAQPQPQPQTESVATENDSITATSVPDTIESDDSPPGPQERLWDRAYDALMEEDHKLMDAYEKILSSKLENGPDLDPTEDQTNVIDPNDKNKRRRQMKRLIDSGLQRTAKEAKIKDSISTVTDVVLSTKDVISAAVENVPQASLAWGGVCVVLEFLTNPLKATGINRSGISEVLKTMSWYLTLSGNVFDKSTSEKNQLDSIQEELEQHAIDLFKSILKYQVNSICSLYRNRGVVFLRDMVLIDDWDVGLKVIKEQADLFERRIQTYSTRQMVDNTGQTADMMKKQVELQLSKQDQECMQALSQTDAYTEKDRIERTKGNLLKESYLWILKNPDFCRWRGGSDESTKNRLLWLRGGAGKGKTMLFCGIINELKSSAASRPISFFFCQATDERINTGTAVLRGLLRLIVKEQPSMLPHVRDKYDDFGKSAFEKWDTLSRILRNILQDDGFRPAYIAIDALDECVKDLPELLALVVEMATKYPRVKWIVTSRNETGIEYQLSSYSRLSLEINSTSVSEAVDSYINAKVESLKSLQKKPRQKKMVQQRLHEKADGTFLWVSLAFQEIQKLVAPDAKRLLTTITKIPSGLHDIYGHMWEKIQTLEDNGLQKQCYAIIATVLLAYRPLHLLELASLIRVNGDLNLEELDLDGIDLDGLDFDEDFSTESMEKLVNTCGSFFTVRDNTVYFVHQSAKEFLEKEQTGAVVFPDGIETFHHTMFSRSMDCMHKTLHRDMYGLSDPAISIVNAAPPVPDPLVSVGYSCVYWIDHLRETLSKENQETEALLDGGAVQTFLEQKYLYWLESLSLLRRMSEGLAIMKTLKDLESQAGEEVAGLIQDAHRFILSYNWIISNNPLQTYVSALVFAPSRSKIRKLFKTEEPNWIATKPAVEEDWSSYLTLQGHTGHVRSVAFSPDGAKIASASYDGTVRIWDIALSSCIWTMKRDCKILSVVFSPSGLQLASSWRNDNIFVSDIASNNHREIKCSSVCDLVVFSPNGQNLAGRSGAGEAYVHIWDVASGEQIRRLKGHTASIMHVAYSADGQRLASASKDKTIRIWDLLSSNEHITLGGNESTVQSVSWSPSGKRLVSGSDKGIIKVWDIASRVCIHTLQGHTALVPGVAFLLSEDRVVSCSSDGTVKTWSTDSTECSGTFISGGTAISALAFSPASHRLALASGLSVVVIDIADEPERGLRDTHMTAVQSVKFSWDGKYLVSISRFDGLKVWDVASGMCIHTFVDYDHEKFRPKLSSASNLIAYPLKTDGVALCALVLKKVVHTHTLDINIEPASSITFSSDGTKLAISSKHAIRIWDVVSKTAIQEIEASGCSALTEDFTKVATVSPEDGTVRVWNTITRTHDHIFQPDCKVLKMAFSADAKLLALYSPEKINVWEVETLGRIYVWEVKTLEWINSAFMRFYNEYDLLFSLTFSKQGHLLVIMNYGKVGIYDVESKRNMVMKRAYFADHKPLLKDGRLLVDRGYLRVPMPLPKILQEEQWEDYGFGSEESWVTLNGKNVLWLPPEYRARKCAVQDLTVGIGSSSGRVAMIGFSPDRTTWPL